jgi:hypothetical protein
LRILSSFNYPEDCQFTTGTVFGGQVTHHGNAKLGGVEYVVEDVGQLVNLVVVYRHADDALLRQEFFRLPKPTVH